MTALVVSEDTVIAIARAIYVGDYPGTEAGVVWDFAMQVNSKDRTILQYLRRADNALRGYAEHEGLE